VPCHSRSSMRIYRCFGACSKSPAQSCQPSWRHGTVSWRIRVAGRSLEGAPQALASCLREPLGRRTRNGSPSASGPPHRAPPRARRRQDCLAARGTSHGTAGVTARCPMSGFANETDDAITGDGKLSRQHIGAPRRFHISKVSIATKNSTRSIGFWPCRAAARPSARAGCHGLARARRRPGAELDSRTKQRLKLPCRKETDCQFVLVLPIMG